MAQHRCRQAENLCGSLLAGKEAIGVSTADPSGCRLLEESGKGGWLDVSRTRGFDSGLFHQPAQYFFRSNDTDQTPVFLALHHRKAVDVVLTHQVADHQDHLIRSHKEIGPHELPHLDARLVPSRKGFEQLIPGDDAFPPSLFI